MVAMSYKFPIQEKQYASAIGEYKYKGLASQIICKCNVSSFISFNPESFQDVTYACVLAGFSHILFLCSFQQFYQILFLSTIPTCKLLPLSYVSLILVCKGSYNAQHSFSQLCIILVPQCMVKEAMKSSSWN